MFITEACIDALKVFARLTDNTKGLVVSRLYDWVFDPFNFGGKLSKMLTLDEGDLLRIELEAKSDFYEVYVKMVSDGSGNLSQD